MMPDSKVPPADRVPQPRKRRLRVLGLCLALGVAMAMPGHAQESEPPSLLVLDLELVDTSGEVTDQTEDHARRLAAIRDTLTTELAAREVYDVLDPSEIPAEIQVAIDATQESQYLHACNGCEIDFARDVGADRVLTGHVRKISSLIMALWVVIKDADTGRPVLRKVLDFRGDTDRAWQQATLYLVRGLEELPPDAR